MSDNKNITINISTDTIIKVILFGLLLLALYFLRSFILVILTSIVIASFIRSAVRKFGKFGSKYQTLSVVLIYLTSILLLVFLFYLFIPILVIETSNLISAIAEFLPESDLVLKIQEGGLAQASIFMESLAEKISFGELITNTKDFVSNLSSGFFQTLSLIFGGFLNFSFIIVISFYLSIQKKGIESFLRIVTPVKHEEYVISLWDRSQRKIAYWIQGQFVLSVLVGVLIYLGLSILGVQNALFIAVLAAVFELIPFGMVLAAIPAISFAYIDGGLTLALMVTGFYIIVQQFETYLFVPLVIEKVVGISPLVVILSLIIGAQLAGFWGIILAIPVAVPIIEFMNDIQKKKKHASHFPPRESAV